MSGAPAGYEILRKIGTGGMAEVLLARRYPSDGLARIVVLKRLLERHRANAEIVTMFRDEARLMAMLCHPGIAQVYALEEQDGIPVLVMEHVDGPTLRAVLDAGRESSAHRLPIRVALAIGVAIAEALAYVHERSDDIGLPLRIVHRDVNPTNVLVRFDGYVKLVDFGIARSETRVVETRTGVLKGTLGYMAPEQLRGRRDLDHRTDVFSLGVVLYELVAGVHPFPATTPDELATRVLGGRFVGLRSAGHRVRRSLARTIEACLASDREARPASVRDVLSGLIEEANAVGGLPVPAEVSRVVRDLVPRLALVERDERRPEGPTRLSRSPASMAPPAASRSRSRSRRRTRSKTVVVALALALVVVTAGAYLVGRVLAGR